MENQNKPSKKNIMINYGLLLGFFGILTNVINYAFGDIYKPHWSINVINIIAMIAAIILGIKEYKKQNGGFLTIAQGLKTGVGIALISAIVSAIYIFVFAKFIEPDFVENIVEIQRQKLLENPNMPEEMIDTFGENTRKYFYPYTIGVTLVFSIFMGFIVSLIASLVMQKKEE
ncbi:DUF4199 domain-containing protein [Aureibaculum marinum]|uniref:DUF4199 domain-containing protein n=1 Tax=Aureibaculum marinum TaxID=2487930 RepID=A0A3N4P886_9FLAO|nr:DUF4199 domain-containing protein [Aureibaculum marinum]RPE00891.1 DUF4199 domain-containing protein [Aureibaculum marinum]